MRWFRKRNEQKIECPHCGTVHTVEFCDYSNVYLDGVPQLPIKDLMRRFVFCSNCGLLYTSGIRETAKCVPTDAVYRTLYEKQYTDITEKKLYLLNLLYEPTYLPLFLAHHYYETHQGVRRTQALQQAQKYLSTHKDACVQELKSCGSLQFENTMMCYPEHRLVDVYRQLQEWDAASELIQQLRAGKVNNALTQYLDLQEELISKQNSDVQ